MYTDEQLLKLEAEEFRYSNPKLYRHIYNQALEDFSTKMKEVNLTNSFVLYYGDEIDLEEFMILASEEIKEQLIKLNKEETYEGRLDAIF